MKLSCKVTNKLNNRGMTLMEILIVLAIIGGLMAVLLPAINKSRNKGNIGTTKITMGQIINALNQFYTDCGKYPESMDGLMTADPSCQNWGPEAYMKVIPKDAWGNSFVYSFEGSSFLLKSYGADRREGGDGVDKDITSEELQ